MLAQVQEELAFNIFKLNDGHNRYRAYDTCVHRVLQKEATYDDYKNKGPLLYFFYRNNAIQIKDDAYVNMLVKCKSFPQEFDSIVLRLRWLYGSAKRRVDFRDKNTSENVMDYIHKLRREKE